MMLRDVVYYSALKVISKRDPPQDRMETTKRASRAPLAGWKLWLARALFTVLQGLYWSFAAGLAWTVGAVASYLASGESAAPMGGCVGIAVSMAMILATGGCGQRRLDMLVTLSFAVFGGAAVCGLVGLLLTNSAVGLIVGYVLGLIVGTGTWLMRQYVPVDNRWLRAACGAWAGAVIGVAGWQLGTYLGWIIAAACGLGLLRLMAELLRRGPVVLINPDNEVVAELHANARWRYALAEVFLWAFRGAIGGLACVALAAWSRHRVPDINPKFLSPLLPDAEPAFQLVWCTVWFPAFILFLFLCRATLAVTKLMPLKEAESTDRQSS